MLGVVCRLVCLWLLRDVYVCVVYANVNVIVQAEYDRSRCVVIQDEHNEHVGKLLLLFPGAAAALRLHVSLMFV